MRLADSPAGPAPTITRSYGKSLRSRAPGDPLDHGLPLVDGVPNEPQPSEFSDDEQPRNAGLVLVAQHREVGTAPGGGHHHGDPPDGAGVGAQTVAHALCAVHEHRLPSDQSQDVPLRAGVDASSAPDAGEQVDLGMHGHRRSQSADLCALEAFAGLLLVLPVPPEIGAGDDDDQHRGDPKGDKRIGRHGQKCIPSSTYRRCVVIWSSQMRSPLKAAYQALEILQLMFRLTLVVRCRSFRSVC